MCAHRLAIVAGCVLLLFVYIVFIISLNGCSQTFRIDRTSTERADRAHFIISLLGGIMRWLLAVVLWCSTGMSEGQMVNSEGGY